jgi:hypothetical protein
MRELFRLLSAAAGVLLVWVGLFGLLDRRDTSSRSVDPIPAPRLLGIRRDALVFALGSLPGLHFIPENARTEAGTVESVTLAEASGACAIDATSLNGELGSVGFRMPDGLSESDPVLAKSLACLMTVADVMRIPNWSANLRRKEPDFTVDGGGRRYRFLRGPTSRGVVVSASP